MSVKITPHQDFQGVYKVILEDGSERIATRNLTPGRNVYGERLIQIEGEEYRIWDPFRSKLAAAILKGMKRLPIKKKRKVLYLGAASGTTASHVSDLVGKDGCVYCIEFSHRSIRDLIDNVCRFRMNMAPILADARFPIRYATLVSKVDVIYCDVAQPEQARILAHNAEVFLKKEGWIMLTIKARSIDVTKEPSEIYRREIAVLRREGFNITEVIDLEPYEKDHAMIIAQSKA
ncbi:TPA: fibrillarin-like rRNA/tRNA 2'-O-methyltransferase [Candidatus Bathyarchaeota archaeon]|nr:fibrillarin-like rRNA/tRNA 2'-O-methyltransferase [Candidatus Bathyarchaeota archaeon]